MSGSGESDDLWAKTRPEGSPVSGPPSDPDATPPSGVPAGSGDETRVVPSGVDPTAVQPIVTGPGQPPPPGGPPGEGGPPDDGDEGGGPPPWLLPAAIALVALLMLGLGFALLRDDGGDDVSSPSTLPATETTVEPLPTTTEAVAPPPETTIVETTTPDTTTTSTVAETTTTSSTTTTSTTTSTTSTTTTSTTSTTTTTTTTTEPPSPLPDPGFASVDGEVVPIEFACRVVVLAPATADRQVVGFLTTTSRGRIQIERWVDEGDSTGIDLLDVDDGTTAGDDALMIVDSGFVATMSGSAGTFEVAVNPPASASDECTRAVQTSPSDIDAFPFNQGALDVCSTSPAPDFTIVALVTDISRVRIVDNGDGTGAVTFESRFSAAPYTGPVTGAGGSYEGTIDNGSETLAFRSSLGPGTRTCDASEL